MKNIEIIDRNNTVIKKFIEDYSINSLPIEVSFRELLPEIKSADRYTHLIHTYTAKLLVHIPYFFLNNTFFSKVGDYVLDPFNGSGTVLLESIIAKRNAFGADANPLARLIAKVKISKYDTNELKTEANKLIKKVKNYKSYKTPDVVNCDFWFSENTKIQLSKLLIGIEKIENEKIRDFMMVSFSNCVKKVSYADLRVSVPVKINPLRFPKNSVEQDKAKARLKSLKTIDVFEKFSSIVNENISKFSKVENLKIGQYKAKIISTDARKLVKNISSEKLLEDEKIQLIITSPPYAGAQKYIRASSLNLGWTKLAKVEELLQLDKRNIGRENFTKSEIILTKTGIKSADKLIEIISKINIKRANIVCTYITEMKVALNEMVRVLKNDGYLVLILGNNKVCNLEFNTQEYLTEFLISKGLKLQFKLIDDIKSYGLMTKRNKTADIISREWILVFKK